MNHKEAVAQAIGQHVWDENQARCSCGERDEANTRQWDYTEHQWARHAAAVVLAALELHEETKMYEHFEPVAGSQYAGHKRSTGWHSKSRWVSSWTSGSDQ